MIATVKFVLDSGVILKLNGEVNTFVDVVRFGRKISDYAASVRRIAPDLATTKVTRLGVECDTSDGKPARARAKKRAPKPPPPRLVSTQENPAVEGDL